MGFKVVEAGRMIQKIITTSGTTFAVAPSSDHTDGSWAANHLYDGEFGINSNPASIKLQVRISGTVYNIPFSTISGSGIAAAGNNTEVQFNDSGALGASSGFTFVKATGQLTLLKDSNYILFDPANEQYGAYIQNASGGGAQVFLNGDNGSDVTATLTALNSAGTRGGSLQVNATSGTASVIAGLSSDVQYKVDGVNQKAYFIVTAVNYHEWGKGYYAVHPASVSGTGEIRFLELAASGSHYAGFKAPDALAASIIYVLPSTDPTVGQVLTAAAPSGGVCVLTWAAGGGGSGLTVGTTTIALGVATQLLYEAAGNVLGEITGVTSNGTYISATTTNIRAVDIADSNGLKSLAFTATATSVDYFTLITAATANPATIKFQATGSDANINTLFSPKGTGKFQISDGTDLTKILAFDLSGGTTAITGTFLFSPTTAKTQSFPNNTGTVPNLNLAQTFSAVQVFNTQINGNSQTAIIFRLTNAGGSVTPLWYFNETSMATAGSKAVVYEVTNGLTWVAGNGTRGIARAGIQITNLVNTAASESADLILLTQAAGAAMSEKMRISSLGNIVHGTAALATNATDGFLYIPTCAGTPTGVPTAYTGQVAMVFDTTNNKFYIYDGGWLGGTTPGVFV